MAEPDTKQGLIVLRRSLAIIEAARAGLAEARSLDEIKGVYDNVAALEVWLRKRNAATDVLNDAIEVRLVAERRMGLMLDSIWKNGDMDSDPNIQSLLEGLGASPMRRSRWRKASSVPENDFKSYLAQTKARFELLTSSAVLKLAARQEDADRLARAPSHTPAMPTKTFACVVADPPWEMTKLERDERETQGRRLHYQTMTVDQIAGMAEQVAGVAAEDCHLYLWVTHKHLPDGLHVLEEWGFRYHCLLTWVKPTGMTPYGFMFNTEHVLFGWRGRFKLLRMGQKLSFEAPAGRGRHSCKPDAFYDLVRSVSPGPRLEMFTRQLHDGFDPWGNEVKEAAS